MSATTEQGETYSELAREGLARMSEHLDKSSGELHAVVEAQPGLKSASQWSLPASVTFAGGLFAEKVQIKAKGVEIDGWLFGPSIAFGGICWGTIWFDVPKEQLAGECQAQCNCIAVATEVHGWRGNQSLFTFAGGGIGVWGPAIVGGTMRITLTG